MVWEEYTLFGFGGVEGEGQGGTRRECRDHGEARPRGEAAQYPISRASIGGLVCWILVVFMRKYRRVILISLLTPSGSLMSQSRVANADLQSPERGTWQDESSEKDPHGVLRGHTLPAYVDDAQVGKCERVGGSDMHV